jgi:hypothetical protein
MCPFGEIIAGGAGGLLGVLLMGKLCWRYIKTKFGHKDCGCDCCKHHER